MSQSDYFTDGPSPDKREHEAMFGDAAPIASAATTVEGQKPLGCYDCGAAYSSLGVDVALPDQQWKELFPEENGLLCANCICKRAKDHGGTVLLTWVDNLVYGTSAPAAPESASASGVSLPCIPLPDGLDFRNGGQQCDMLNGPCACGAWHHVEDLTFRIFNQLKAERAPSVPAAPEEKQ